jgi:N-dimethylarginine dimethylaminohydrolase
MNDRQIMPAVRGFTEFGRLEHVVLKHARDAFDAATLSAQWPALHFAGAPNRDLAIEQYDRFVEILRDAGAEISFLEPDRQTGLDSIYVRDASIVSPAGMIIGRMGKTLRASEPAAQEREFRRLGLPVAGTIHEPGQLEGGDLVWLDAGTVAVGEGYRSNAEGIRQLRALLGQSIDVIAVPLPHWRGPGDVLHLMSLISPIDRDLAVVYSPLMAVPFRTRLLERGYSLIEVPDEEFESMGTNVLALAPRRCLMLSGNPRTRAALEHAGAEVVEYEGSEISVKGAGGPTCLTRPVRRE